MGFLMHRIATSVLGRRYRSDADGMRETPERVVLGVRTGTRPSEKPPVRIFLGTEPGQARAERVFFWSIEQVRDPGRVYEIYLMKDLAGFRRQFWLTGFTNYRFAIPQFAGGRGRAIYNDVDQIYLADPGRLFDTDMGEHGFLSVLDTDTSVMLIDCERMSSVWPLDAARRRHRRALEAAAREVPALWGPLDPEWNARDDEYVAGRSRLLHFTTLHTQPWNPFPSEYVYRPNPVGEVWFALERSADAAGYYLFSAEQPSAGYRKALESVRPVGQGSTGGGVALSEIADLLGSDRAEVGRILDYGGGAPGNGIEVWDPLAEVDERPRGDFETAVAFDWLDVVPGEDLPWTIERIFAAASRHVLIRVAASKARTPEWWRQTVTLVAARHPRKRWVLVLGTSERTERRFDGGPGHEGPGEVWVIVSGKPGHTSQAVGLARALGWTYQLRVVRAAVSDYASLLTKLPAMPGGGLASLGRHWPDAVIASGWLATRTARWIEYRSGGETRAILLGRKGGPPRSWSEIAVSCAHYRLPEHPHRVQVVLPPHPVTPEALSEAAARRRDLVDGSPAPRTVLLVGGSSGAHRLDATTARRLGSEIAEAVAAKGGSLFVVTSRRTGREATKALREAVGSRGHVHAWRPNEVDNPYLSYVALADILIVTGESESMVAEAVATGKSVYIYPLPEAPANIWRQLSARVAEIAERPRLNRRGTVRPQQGLEYLCARLIERGFILPPRDLDALHRLLVERGIARVFQGEIESWQPAAFDATVDAAARVRALMGYARPSAKAEDRQPDFVAGYSS